jgi:hypothetical protein
VEYTIEIALQAKRPLTVTALERISAMGGVATGNPGERRLETTMTVAAADIPTAIAMAIQQVTERVAGTVIAIEAMTTTEADRRMEVGRELVGLKGAAQLLGISKQQAFALSQRKGFPPPFARLESGPIWHPNAIKQFAATWERKPGRPKKSPETIDSVN